MANDERKFLHDISTPIATALFLVDILIEEANGGKPIDVENLINLLGALTKAQEKLVERKKTAA